MKDSIKREQSQAGLSFAERKNQRSLAGGESNFRPKVKRNRLLLLLALLITAVGGAWAQTQITQDFENGLGDWTKANCHSSTGVINTYSPTHSGTNMFRFYYSANTQYLISPEIDAAGGGTMSFYYARYSGNYTETFKVGYSTTTNDPTAFTWGDEVTCTNIFDSEGYLEYTYDIPAGAKYVSIACTSPDRFYFFIDDIKIEYAAEAAPAGFTVSLKSDVKDADKWTVKVGEGQAQALPIGGLKGDGSETVTLTYNGRLKVKGVKATSDAAPAAVSLIVNPVVGQIIGSDGKNYDANATLPDGVTAVAKIFYVGSDAETSTTYNHGLALALSDVSGTQTWCSQTSSTCLTTQYSSSSAAKADMAGLANTDALVGHGSHTHNAASAARGYNSGTHPTGTSEWFLPSAGQWDKMATAAGGYGNLKTNAGLQSDDYWSSSEDSDRYAWYFTSGNGSWYDDRKDLGSLVRACLAF